MQQIIDHLDEVSVEELQAALNDLSEAIGADENVMPPTIDAVKAYATMDEIMAVFEEYYGSYQGTISLA